MLRPLLARMPLLRSRVLWVYLGLLLASNVVIALRSPEPAPPLPAGAEALRADLSMMSEESPAAGGARLAVSILKWSAPATPEKGVLTRAVESVKEIAGAGPVAKAPIVLVHGAPSGGGKDFKDLAPRLAAAGYTVYAPDVPPYGVSEAGAPTYSIKAGARMLLAMMDELKIDRAHIVGCGFGGGGALHLNDFAPGRVASLTLLSAIGPTETEGSGSHRFEHFKYRLGHIGLTVVAELVPHFGLLGSREHRWTMLRPFIDTDQRPLKGIMSRVRAPTLILHGRHDFLEPAWAAEDHHALIGPSTLVMLDGGHFLHRAAPMGSERALKESAEHLLAFVAEHDAPGGAARRQAAVFELPEKHITRKLGGLELQHGTRWWLIVLVIFIATFISEDITTITVGLLMVSQSIDWGVALLGCFIAIFVGDISLWVLGRTLGRRVVKLPLLKRIVTEQSLEKWGRVLDQHTGKTVLLARCLPGTRMPTFIAAGVLSSKAHHFLFWVAIAAFIWTPFLLALTVLIGPSVLGVFQALFHGPWAIIAAVVAVFIVVRLVGYETTAQGRDRLKADLKRVISLEFWPAWLFYLPLLPQLLWLSLRRGGAMTFTCANPGIGSGGGMVGESKSEVLAALMQGENSRWVLPWVLIPAGDSAESRAGAAIEAVEANSELGGYPVILKPDDGFRGYGVKVARSAQDVRAYFKLMDRAALVQKYHAGPYEMGVLWSRVPRNGAALDSLPGEVFSATTKEFPVIEGDGKRTLELLIWHHPRCRMQADVFLKRFAGQTDRVLAPGEKLALSLTGNHSQGAKMIDGMPAITQELAARIEEVAQRFRDPATGGRFDFGRFDLRYASKSELARGEGFAIVEVNGTSSESTSMYDPSNSVWWTYGLLYRHWSRLYQLGASRRREGTRPMRLRELVRAWRKHRRGKPPMEISD